MSQEWPGQQPSKQRRGRTVEIGSGCPTYLTAGFPGKETPWLSLQYTQVMNGLAAERRVGVREELPMQGGGGGGKEQRCLRNHDRGGVSMDCQLESHRSLDLSVRGVLDWVLDFLDWTCL